MEAALPMPCRMHRRDRQQSPIRMPFFVVLALLLFVSLPLRAAGPAQSLRVEVTFPASLQPAAVNGRLYLMVSTDASREPRLQINDGPETQQFFAIQVHGWKPGQPAFLDASALGYPQDSLRDLRPGDYTVQALLNLYTTFHLADGRVLQLPMDEGEGQQWNSKPGNLYSRPQTVHIEAGHPGVVQIALSEKIPPVAPVSDTAWIKHIHLQSRLLTHFWGHPMSLGAIILLPAGWADHPQAQYPVVIYQGHFQRHFSVPVGFRDHPPDANAHGNEREYQEYSYRFYQQWTQGKLPHVILVIIQHANPYYDDSYAVNSANVGPYGDAITKELVPWIERKYRGIGQPWARAMFGGSTGGWETLGMQIFYPDYFNGAWAACPDPVDFRAYQIVDIYHDQNAYWLQGPWSKVPRPSIRRPDGAVISTMDRENRRELVLGTRGRSTEQFNIWQAVFGPPGPDGYPARIWDPRTGVIHPKVAQYWHDHYDLRAWMQQHWSTLGPKLQGKIHVTVGDMDTYYLNNAVHLLQQFMASSSNPHVAGTFQYGPGQPHCFWGGPAGITSFMSGLTAPGRILPEMVEHMKATAPAGADLTSWNY